MASAWRAGDGEAGGWARRLPQRGELVAEAQPTIMQVKLLKLWNQMAIKEGE
jgi:hypothetical protein